MEWPFNQCSTFIKSVKNGAVIALFCISLFLKGGITYFNVFLLHLRKKTFSEKQKVEILLEAYVYLKYLYKQVSRLP